MVEQIIDENSAAFYSIPEKIDPVEAIWYFNLMESRRTEIYAAHFAPLKSMEEWLEIYIAAPRGSAAWNMALSMLTAMTLPLSGWIELHEARHGDDRIDSLCIARIERIADGDFQKWKEAFTLASYESVIRQLGMTNMLRFAKTIEEWREVYDNSELCSQEQEQALEQILLAGRFERPIRRMEQGENENDMLKRAKAKGPKEWREEYEKRDHYDASGEAAVCNIYISADLAESERNERAGEEIK
ncbi:MAG: hypothetical protein LBE89_01260 [Helicobacteraceae bacterium]|nr:hypothetical protein [Helicobacteraceae bacterium]